MKSKYLSLCIAVLLLISLAVAPAQAQDSDDPGSHIAANNSDWVISSDPPQLLSEENGWLRDEKNLITNFYSMYHPEVVYVPEWDTEDGYPYLMWFFAWAYNQENDAAGQYPGYPGGDAIFLARAKALEGPWEVYSLNYRTEEFFWDAEQKPYFWYPVITCQDTWYDSWHVGDPSVVYKDGLFHMAYSSMGCDEDLIPSHHGNDTDGNASCIMGAVSQDGINWTRSEKPLIVWEGEKGFNEKTDRNSWYGGHQRPSLTFEDGKWKMWYDYKENQVGYAECDGDFLTGNWTELRSGSNPLFTGVDFDVVKIGSVYYGYGDPYISWCKIKDDQIPSYSDDPSKWSQRQIVEYQSLDGINWTPTGWFRPDSGYDAIQIPQVFLDHKNGRVCIFYATQRGKRESTSYDWRWDNIRMMYRDIALFDTGAEYSPTPTPSAQTPAPSATDSFQTPAPSQSSIPSLNTSGGQTAPALSSQPSAPARKTSAGPVILAVSAVIAAAAVAGAIIFLKLKRKEDKK